MTLIEGQTYTDSTNILGGSVAKEVCDCHGHLAVIDTEAKQTALMNQV